MKSNIILSLAMLSGVTLNLRADIEPSVEKRLVKSAVALQTFRESATESTRGLLDHALCIFVAPRREGGENAADMNGFASCRAKLDADWSNPAAITMEGGGIFWPVYSSRIDVILLATNPSIASHFKHPRFVLGADPPTVPGPVRPDQVLPRVDRPVLFAFEQSEQGIVGISIGGATLSEDQTANAILYGTNLNSAAVLNCSRPGGRVAIHRFLAVLSSSPEQGGDTSRESLWTENISVEDADERPATIPPGGDFERRSDSAYCR